MHKNTCPYWRAKKRYCTQKRAMREARFIRDFSQLPGSKTCSSFKCDHCGGWHIGRSERSGQPD